VFLSLLGGKAEHSVAQAGLDVERPDDIGAVGRVMSAAEIPRAERGIVAVLAGVGRKQRKGGFAGEDHVLALHEANGQLVISAALHGNLDIPAKTAVGG